MDNSSSSTGSLPELAGVFRIDDMLDYNDYYNTLRSIFGLDQPPTQSEPESKLKRNSPSETKNLIQRKRLADQKYRQRCKEIRQRTTEEVDNLRNEMERLTKENEVLKMEVLDKSKSHQSLKEMMKQLQKNLDETKTQNQSHSILVRVISEQLHSASDVDLRRENANLKKQIEHLMNLIDHPSKFEIFKLEQEKEESEQETRVLKVIVKALCEKIYQKQQVM